MSIAEEQDLALEYDISFAVHTSVSLMDREGVWGGGERGRGGVHTLASHVHLI